MEEIIGAFCKAEIRTKRQWKSNKVKANGEMKKREGERRDLF